MQSILCCKNSNSAPSPVGGTIDLVATAVDADGDPVAYFWSARDGSIADPTAAITEYTRTVAGTDVIDLVADDGHDCDVARTISVVCADEGDTTAAMSDRPWE